MLALVTTGVAATAPQVYAFAAATLVLAIGGLAIAGLLLGRRGWLAASVVDFATWSGVLAAGLSFGAAAIHFAVISEHFAEWPPYGVAFTAFAWFQVGWAVLYIRRPSRRLAALAIVVNVGALLVWADSRLVGLPIGPDPGSLEPVGPLDVLSAGFEITMISVLGWDLAAPTRRRPGLAAHSAVAYVGSAILAVVVLTSAVFAQTGGSSHSGAAHGESAASDQLASGDVPGDGHSHPSPAGSDASASADVPAAPSAAVEPPGTIVFGSGLDLAGELQGATATFRPGQIATWLAELSEPPDAPSVRLMIFQILPEGREVEHWRQDLPVVDPGGRQLVGMADLSIYVHGGAGSYRMRYLRGDVLLAEGAFDFAP